MFEDSTFESTGRIRTRSRRWMVATFVLNGSILVALVLIPLIYPEALPRQMMNILPRSARTAATAASLCSKSSPILHTKNWKCRTAESSRHRAFPLGFA